MKPAIKPAMTPRQTLPQRVARFAAPVVGLFALYALLLYMPLARSLTEKLAKEHKLQELVQRRTAEHSVHSDRLAAVGAEMRSLTDELEAAKRLGAHLVTRRADRREQVFSVNSPASLIARTLELLGRHRLECWNSTTVARPAKPQEDSLAALKPVADLLGAVPGERNGRREVRITLSGRFQDLQAAVREIQRELTGAFIVSLEMEPADASDAQTRGHTWILTISV